MSTHRSLLLVVALASLGLGLVACSPSSEAPNASTVTSSDWYTGRVIYEINLPEFSPDGTLDGAIAGLDRLQGLGLEVVVLDPIHPRGGVSPTDTFTAHPYSVQDHLGVAAEIGGPAAFDRFLAAAHDRGIRVVLDMVLNHGAVDHVMMVDHPEYFARDAEGNLTRKIPTWRSIVDFAHDDPAVRGYHEQILKTWQARGVDGFRFLHANLQDHEYWRAVLGGMKRSHPEVYLLADAKNPALLEAGFDGIYKPQFFEASTFAIIDDMAQPGLQDDIWYAAVDTVYSIGARGTIFLEDRFLQRSAETFRWPLGQGYAAALMTLPGTPKLYNGQEWGVTTLPDLVQNAPLDPAAADAGWSALYEDLLALRTTVEALRIGEPRRLPAEKRELLVFTRETADETILVAVNFTDTGPEFDLPEDMARQNWREWTAGKFETEARPLSGKIRVEPCGYRVWSLDR